MSPFARKFSSFHVMVCPFAFNQLNVNTRPFLFAIVPHQLCFCRDALQRLAVPAAVIAAFVFIVAMCLEVVRFHQIKAMNNKSRSHEDTISTHDDAEPDVGITMEKTARSRMDSSRKHKIQVDAGSPASDATASDRIKVRQCAGILYNMSENMS